jgi:hypothetical protein
MQPDDVTAATPERITMELREIESALVNAIGEFSGQLPPEQLDGMRELAKAGEQGIALENLLAQIAEYQVAVNVGTLETLRKLGLAMGIDPKYWNRI